MVEYVPDDTGRFSKRPFYQPADLDFECEEIIFPFLRKRHGQVEFPISTDDLTCLIETKVSDLDLYSDLSEFGLDVEGVTEFFPGKKPVVRISSGLADDERRSNRLRTTLAHEFAHVHFHGYLWEFERSPRSRTATSEGVDRQVCHRETIINAPMSDWMEWQAGFVSCALLMPASDVRAAIKPHFSAARRPSPIASTSEEAGRLAALLQGRFDVSRQAAEYRLHNLGYLYRGGSAASSLPS